MEMIRQALSLFLQVVEEIAVGLEKAESLTELGERAREAFNGCMCEIYRLVLEEKDRLFLVEPERRPGWVVVRKDKRTLLTPFGEVKYTRTYYRHKETGEYAYLADRSLGVEAYKRMEAGLRADLVAAVVEKSYRKSGSGLVSGQAVKDVVMGLKLTEEPVKEKPRGKKRVVRVLYIEGDEDHVALQRGGHGQARLVYVHEGWRQVARDRWELVNVRYFGCGPGESAAKLWEEVWAYVEAEYDLSRVEVIYLLGDGAAWIREGLEWTTHKKVVFLLDRFHVAKYVFMASLGDKGLRMGLMEAVWQAEREKVEELLIQAEKKARTPKEKAKVEKARKYILGNWEAIAAWKEHGEEAGGCSAEGHVSHVYSLRLSGRPCAWSEKGLGQMTRLCVLKANGVPLREYVLAQWKPQGGEPLGLVEIGAKIRSEVVEAKKAVYERLDNIPVLRGHKTPLWFVLQQLRDSA